MFVPLLRKTNIYIAIMFCKQNYNNKQAVSWIKLTKCTDDRNDNEFNGTALFGRKTNQIFCENLLSNIFQSSKQSRSVHLFWYCLFEHVATSKDVCICYAAVNNVYYFKGLLALFSPWSLMDSRQRSVALKRNEFERHYVKCKICIKVQSSTMFAFYFLLFWLRSKRIRQDESQTKALKVGNPVASNSFWIIIAWVLGGGHK